MVGKLQDNERLGRVDDEGFILAQRPPANTGVEGHRRVLTVVFRWDPETSKISRMILRNKGIEQSEFWGFPACPEVYTIILNSSRKMVLALYGNSP